jgi:hypothetical protein
MNTLTKAASTSTILAIDLGKYKSVACVHDEASGTFRFTSFETTRSEMHRLLTRDRPTVVIIEACLLAGWVHDLCAELGIRCLVANTASEAWKFKHLKRKTDRDDAQRLAQLYLLGQSPTVTLPPTAVRQWRSLIACRQTLVGRRIAVQNRIRALFVAQGLPAPRGARAWAATGLAGMASWARPLADCAADELWRGLLDLSLTEYRQLCELSIRPKPGSTPSASSTPTWPCWRRRRAWAHAPPRPWPPTCTTRRASRPASRCRLTAAWCRASISRGRWAQSSGAACARPPR